MRQDGRRVAISRAAIALLQLVALLAGLLAFSAVVVLVAFVLTATVGAAIENFASQAIGEPVVSPNDEFHWVTHVALVVFPPVALWYSLRGLDRYLGARRRARESARSDHAPAA